jgi:hypothetical protein
MERCGWGAGWRRDSNETDVLSQYRTRLYIFNLESEIPTNEQAVLRELPFRVMGSP